MRFLRLAADLGTIASSTAGHMDAVFFFFSNRLGCLGSLAISVVVTVVLLLIFL